MTSTTIAGASLEEATRLEGSDGRYTIRLSRAWEIWGPNGGYLAAIALRAAGLGAAIARPASLSAQFLASPRFDLVEVQVSLLRRGKRAEAYSVTMTQDDRPFLQALVRTAAPAPGYDHQPPGRPQIQPPHASPEVQSGPFPFWHNVQRRRAEPDSAREWVRFRPIATFADPFVDAARSLILLDTYGWPTVYQQEPDRSFIAPSLDISVWFHRPTTESEWLLIDHEYVSGHQGLLGVSGQVWDEAGHLVANGSSQLCCVPAPVDP